MKWFVRIVLALCALLVVLLAVYRFLPPVSTLMLSRYALMRPVQRTWVPLERISPNLIAAVTTSEDGGFCRNHGVDWGALREVIGTHRSIARSRGASTIHMQTVKNLFLWPSHSVIRKGLEIPLALLLDLVWPKRRVMEVYLNIAEWGDGIFGAEAAARRYFRKAAADLSPREAALLAAALPNPGKRNPAAPTGLHSHIAAIIMARLRNLGVNLTCLR